MSWTTVTLALVITYAVIMTVCCVHLRIRCSGRRATPRRFYTPMPDRCPIGYEPRCVPSDDSTVLSSYYHQRPTCAVTRPRRVGYFTYDGRLYDLLLRQHCPASGYLTPRRRYWDVFARRRGGMRWINPVILLARKIRMCPSHGSSMADWWSQREQNHSDAHLAKNLDPPVFYLERDYVMHDLRCDQ